MTMLPWKSCLPILVVLTIFGPFSSYQSSDPVAEDDEGYIDPFDMENFQHPSSKKTPPSQPKIDDEIPLKMTTGVPTTPPTTAPPKAKPKENTAPKCDKPDSKSQSNILFRNYVKFLLGKFRGKLQQSSSTEEFLMWVKMSGDDVNNLEIFASGQSSNVHDAHEILTSMIKRVTKSHYGTTEKMQAWFQDKFGFSLWDVIQILAMIALVCVIMAAGFRIHLTWRQFVLKACILAFLISIPMTWYELYKAAEIQQQTVAMKDAPPECVKEKEDLDDGVLDTWFGVAQSAFRGLFTFKKDNCQKYYEHMLINPFLKVPPTKALAVTFVRFFVSPLKDVGEALGEFLRALLIDLPITLYPIAIATVTIFFFLLLFMWMGYSIRLPFFLSIEPGQTTVVGGDTGTQEALEEHSKEMQNQMKAIQDALVSQEEKVMERIMHMEKVQMASIEYGASLQQQGAGDNRPPTLPKRANPAAHPQMSIEASDRDMEKSLSSTSSGGSIVDHCPNIENTELKSPIPCSEVADSENWTQITTDDIIKDEGVGANTSSALPGTGEPVVAGPTQPTNEVVTLRPAGIQTSDAA
ncbi:chloride channel CLIC-like protein 1 [Pecten maximus]|uniref:chloride channel CLIC-like protein 1 n=1 Tax=Pecten maximus TaxID=6579 RepID=UPI001458A8E2|nr:chloride channel CLIC-like protein 1 [Pecten maximus]